MELHYGTWKFCADATQARVAVWQDAVLEVRTIDSGFQTVAWSCATLPHDPHPKWRALCWAPAPSRWLACADSRGDVRVFADNGMMVGSIASRDKQPGAQHPGDTAVVSMLFARQGPSLHLLTLTLAGRLRVHAVQDAAQVPVCDIRLPHLGMATCMDLALQHGLLVVGGAVRRGSQHPCSQFVVLRLLNEAPFVAPFDVSVSLPRRMGGGNLERPAVQHVVCNATGTRCSHCNIVRSSHPCGRIAVHSMNGELAILRLPGFQHEALYQPEELLPIMGHDASKCTSTVLAAARLDPRSSALPDAIRSVAWWDEQHLILQSFAGAFLVSPVQAPGNLLGKTVEHVAPCSAFGSAVLLDTEANRRRLVVLEQVDTYLDHNHKEVPLLAEALEPGLSMLQRIKRFLHWSLQIELFNSDIAFVEQTFNLVDFQTITPYEDVCRKLQKEEYGTAAELAVEHGLGTDLVYQYQWNAARSSACPLEALAKVQNVFYVLDQCFSFVPSKLDNIKRLLTVGMKRIQESEILGSPRRSAACLAPVRPIHAQMTYNSLCALHQEALALIRSRKRLLDMQDQLYTYEVIARMPVRRDTMHVQAICHAANMDFQLAGYQELRAQSFAQYVVSQALQCQFAALRILLLRLGCGSVASAMTVCTDIGTFLGPICSPSWAWCPSPPPQQRC